MAGAGRGNQVTETDIILSDVTTKNATAGQHGFTPKLSGVATQYFDGSGAFSAPAVGALTRTGGNTTEATTTSTTVVDLLAVAGLNISAATPFFFREVFRKTAGFAGAAGFGLKINTTEVGTPAAANNDDNLSGRLSTTNAAQQGSAIVWVSSVVASYTFHGAYGVSASHTSIGSTVVGAVGISEAGNPQPNATRTDVIVNAISTDAAVTAGADEMHVYTHATS